MQICLSTQAKAKAKAKVRGKAKEAAQHRLVVAT